MNSKAKLILTAELANRGVNLTIENFTADHEMAYLLGRLLTRHYGIDPDSIRLAMDLNDHDTDPITIQINTDLTPENFLAEIRKQLAQSAVN